MDPVWLALMSGTFGALLASGLAFATQLYLSRRAERQEADRERVSTVLEFTGRSSAMVMWAIYVNGHVSKATEPMTLPAILVRQFSTVDLQDVATAFISHTTELVRLHGHLVATQGREMQSVADDIVATTLAIVEGYLSPKESRTRWRTWIKPFAPADLRLLKDLEQHRARVCREFELLILAKCSTLKGRELSRELPSAEHKRDHVLGRAKPDA